MATWAEQETAATEFAEALATHGGPAFPAAYALPSGGTFTSSGMTLRDWFAGQYLNGVFASDPGSHLGKSKLAADAYAYADAMLAERLK